MRVLLVEDEDAMVAALVPALHRRGFTVERVAVGRAALGKLAGVDVVLLDLVLPDIDGVVLCRQIRAASDVPIIVVSALDGVADRILALHAGADDYLVKGYDMGELAARMFAVSRRGGAHGLIGSSTETIVAGDTEVHLGRREVTVAGEVLPLSRREFDVLALVAEARGALLTRERVLAQIWRDTSAELYEELERHVASIRTRLGRPWVIDTVREVGYKLGRPPARRG